MKRGEAPATKETTTKETTRERQGRLLQREGSGQWAPLQDPSWAPLQTHHGLHSEAGFQLRARLVDAERLSQGC